MSDLGPKCNSCKHGDVAWYNEPCDSCTSLNHYEKKENKMGKKYIIELEDKVSENAKGEPLYFVKGFNNLSLDETALKKLTELKEEHEFKVGDVVRYRENSDLGVITDFDDGFAIILFSSGDVCWADKYDLTYLNRNINSKLIKLKETYEAFRAREQQRNKEELERNLRIKELRAQDEITESKIRSMKRKAAKEYWDNNKEEIKKRRKEHNAKFWNEHKDEINKKRRTAYQERKLQSNESSKETD